ncbi:MAG: Maf family protein [Anaerolineales bacterium]
MGQPLLVLASNSPRRRELLALGGWIFNTRPTEVDESQRPGEAPGTYVLRLAESKARTCPQGTFAHEDLTILAADTAVVDGKAILGKPKDMAEAVEMLRRLRSRTHQVYTGIAVRRLSDGNLGTDLCVTDVPMRAYSEEEIDAYVATGDPLDKAGAYAIQHPKFHPVEMMSGCYASVMGLPLCHLTRTLRQLDIAPKTNISAECQSSLNYTCLISAAVLRGEQVG